MNRINPVLRVPCGFLAFLLALIALLFRCKWAGYHGYVIGKDLRYVRRSVSKARVTITSAATGFVRTVQSSDTGEYTIPALKAGEYTVSVEFAGFRKQSKNVILQVGQSAELDFTLTPGGVEEKVELRSRPSS